MFQMSWGVQILLLIKDVLYCIILNYEFEVMQSFGAYKSFLRTIMQVEKEK